MKIFIVHPSSLLTDHALHGDGLAAHSFIAGMAERGHDLHVAVERVDLMRDLGPRVTLYPLRGRSDSTAVRRAGYAARVGKLFARLHREVGFDVAHQLNPVDTGLSLLLPRTDVPLLLGPYWPLWPPEAIGLRDTRRQRLLGPAGQLARRVVATLQQRRATTLLVSTPAALERLHGAPDQSKIRELPYGIDLRAFADDSDDPSVFSDGPVLFLAGLEPWKGVLVLLEAFELVADRIGGRRLVIGGDGSLAATLRRRVDASPLRSRIDVVGRVAHDDVPSLLRGCSLYCLPSLREPFGISALEAMACGRPVLGTDAGGLPHLVGEGGRLVPPGDVRALGSALQELLTDPALLQRLGARNARLVHRRYSWEHVVEELESAYREAVASAVPRR